MHFSVNTYAGEESKPILVQGAMDMEIDKMVDALENPREITYAGWTFWEGKINDYPIVVSRTEIGMANAAAATTLAIEKFHPCVIINQGTSGGHDIELENLDIVLGEKIVSLGVLRSEHRDEGEGIAPKNWIPNVVQVQVNGERISFHNFESSGELIEIAEGIKEKYQHGKVVRGVIGTDDFWNKEIDRIKWLNGKFGTSVEEMETASVAHVAKAYGIPFLGIRIISNSEPRGTGWQSESGVYCQEYVLEVIAAIIDSESSYDKGEADVYLSNSLLTFIEKPISRDGIIYFPAREFFDKVGAELLWNPENRRLGVKIDGDEVFFKEGNGCFIEEDRMYVAAASLAFFDSYKVVIKNPNEIHFQKTRNNKDLKKNEFVIE